MDFRDTFKILRKNLLIIIACVVVVVSAAVFVIWRRPTLYTAYSRIAVRTEFKNYGSYEQFPILAEMSALDNYRNVQTQAEFLKSSTIREIAFKKMNLTLSQIQSIGVKVTTENDSDVLRIQVTSTDSKLAVNFANKLPAVFLDYIRDQPRNEADSKANFYKKQIQDLTKQLSRKRIQLEIFKRDNIKGDLANETSNVTKTYYDFRNLLKTTNMDLEETQQKIDEFQASLGQQTKNTVRVVEARNQLIDQLKSEQADLEIGLARASQKYGPEHPEIMSIEEQLDIIKGKLKHEYETGMVASQRVEERNPVHDAMTEQLAQLYADREALTNKAGALNTLVQESALPLKSLPEKEKQLVELDAEILELQETKSQLQQKYNDLSLTKGLPNEKGQITDFAEYAVDMNRSKKIIGIIIAVMGGFFIGMIFAFVREYFDDTLYTTAEVEEALQLQVLGQIPDEKNLGRVVSVCADKPNSPVSESFRALRNRIKYLLAEGDIRMFMVTSSAVQEGKSFISLNLAITMAQYGHKVLLVDADLRRPTLHRVFDLPNKGISNVVFDGEDVTSLIVETDVPNLSALCAGPLPLLEASPVISSEIFEDKKIEDMINFLHISYDYVIFDTPPILAVTDVLTLSAHVPGVLFVVSSGDMQRGDVVNAKQMLEATGARILGAVLNRTQHAVSYYKYLYYYYDKDSGNKKYRYVKY